MRRLLPLVAAALLLSTLAPAAEIVLPRKADSLKFAVIGDSGSGTRQQYETAKQLADAHDQFPYEFVLMLGDNIYGKQKARDLFRKFEQPYRRILDQQVPFYATLGNHDDPAIQTVYKPFNMDGKRYFSFKKGPAEFFSLDSTYMTPEQTKWLEKELSESGAKWKIAFMHHPIYSSGKRHGSDLALRAFIEPLFLKYGVDLALAGHEHFYERLKPQQGINYFIAGSAGKLRAGNIRPGPLHEAGFDTDLSFILMEIDGDDLYFQVISRTGTTVDQGQISRRTTITQ
jgi:DNA repair exonuclease SbcCD nuclease subunit